MKYKKNSSLSIEREQKTCYWIIKNIQCGRRVYTLSMHPKYKYTRKNIYTHIQVMCSLLVSQVESDQVAYLKKINNLSVFRKLE